MRRPVKVFIVEGENRELRFFEAIKRLFLKDFDDSIIINVPSAGNIYMLYEKLKKDDFETDVIEVVREEIKTARELLEDVSRSDVTEVYLFFDADLHSNNFDSSNNAEDLLLQMLSVFDNETENGKLYISYPMVEALYDVREDDCRAFSKCWISIDGFADYKRIAGMGNPLASRHFRSETEWEKVIQAFYVRVKCLFDIKELSFAEYKDKISPLSIFAVQNKWIREKASVFVLSAIPELLLDYFKKDFWEKYVNEGIDVKESCGESWEK